MKRLILLSIALIAAMNSNGQILKQILTTHVLSVPPSPPSIIASTSKGGGSGGGTTSAIDTTGATMLFVVVADDSSTSAIADSKGNTWRHLTVYSNTSSSSIWYSYDKAGAALVTGAGHTVTLSTGDFPFFIFAAANNTRTSPTDPYTGVQNGPGNTFGNTIQTGTVTPSGTSLIVTGLGAYTQTGVFTIDSGFTIIAQSPVVGSTNYAGAAAYLVGGSAVNPIWTLSGNSSLTTSIAIFK